MNPDLAAIVARDAAAAGYAGPDPGGSEDEKAFVASLAALDGEVPA